MKPAFCADSKKDHEVLPLVLALPPDAARKRLVKALRDAAPANRQAAVNAIANMSYTDRLQLISPLRDDQDKFVRESVQAYPSRIAASVPGDREPL